MIYKRLPHILAVSSVLGLAACGGSDSTSTTGGNTTGTTTFNVSVDAPQSYTQTAALERFQYQFANRSTLERVKDFFLAPAMAVEQADLTADNFAVTILNPDGTVAEIVTISADNISSNGDGSYEISVPGDPRLDCVVVVDLEGPITITAGQPLPDDALFAPTTAIDVDIDIASTAAYQQFLEEVDSFDDLTVEEVETLVNNVQELDIPEPNDGESLSAYLTRVESTVEDVIEAQVTVATAGSSGDIAALANAGLYWVEQSGDVPEYGHFGFDTNMTIFDDIYEYDAENSAADANGFVASSGVDESDIILGPNGWVQESLLDGETAVANSDGSYTFPFPDGSTAISISAISSVDLTGESINTYLAQGDTEAWQAGIFFLATFTSGAQGYLATLTEPARYDIGYFNNGECQSYGSVSNNCSVVMVGGNAATALSALIGSEVGVGDGMVVAIQGEDGDTSGSAVYTENGSSTSVSSTWSLQTINSEELLVVEVPDAVRDGLWEEDTAHVSFSVYDEYVRNVWSYEEDNWQEWLFNQAAMEDILAAYSPANAQQLEACVTGDSVWDDVAEQPETPASYSEFLTAVAGCTTSSAVMLTEAMLIGETLVSGDGFESVSFNADGSGAWEDEFETITFDWAIENGNLVLTNSENGVIVERDTIVVLATGSDDQVSIKGYYEESAWSDMNRDTGSDGEIWSDVMSFE